VRVGAEAVLRNLKRAGANKRAKYRPEVLETIESRGGFVPPAGGATAHPQDAAAVEWARGHPGDPRAAKILALNGG